MEKLLVEKIGRITKNRERLQEALNVKISNKSKEVLIEGASEDEYLAGKVVEALDFGFPFSDALLIVEEDFLFEILNIKDYTKRHDLERVRARIIGRGGKTLKTLTTLTKCNIEIKGNQVGIIGDPEQIRTAQEGVISLIRGSKQGNVYSYLEKHQAQPILDFGLKPIKSKKGKKNL